MSGCHGRVEWCFCYVPLKLDRELFEEFKLLVKYGGPAELVSALQFDSSRESFLAENLFLNCCEESGECCVACSIVGEEADAMFWVLNRELDETS